MLPTPIPNPTLDRVLRGYGAAGLLGGRRQHRVRGHDSGQCCRKAKELGLLTTYRATAEQAAALVAFKGASDRLRSIGIRLAECNAGRASAALPTCSADCREPRGSTLDLRPPPPTFRPSAVAMPRIAELLQFLRNHPRLSSAVALTLTLLTGAFVLQRRAADQAQTRQLAYREARRALVGDGQAVGLLDQEVPSGEPLARCLADAVPITTRGLEFA